MRKSLIKRTRMNKETEEVSLNIMPQAPLIPWKRKEFGAMPWYEDKPKAFGVEGEKRQ
jgi:hypothetical protein